LIGRSDTLVYSIYFADDQAHGSGGRFGGMGRGGMEGGWGGMGGGMGRRGGMGGPRMQQQRPDGKKILQQISKETGGRFFEVSKKQSLEQIYKEIEEELRNQYSLGYTPDKPAPGYHTIKLTTNDKSLNVVSREGYYSSASEVTAKQAQ
jgi:VWFA-related protein